MPANIVELIKYRREVIKFSGKRLPRRRKPPIALHPRAIEMGYYKAILELIQPMFATIKEQLFPMIPGIIAAYEQDTRIDASTSIRTDSYGTIITQIFDDIEVGVVLSADDIEGLSDRFARRTASFNKVQVDKQFKSVLGLEVIRAERWLEPQVSAFVERNVSLIKTIGSDHLKKVDQMVRHAVESGV